MIQDPAKKALDRQFDRMGWGLFLIMIGGLALVPGNAVPGGTWLIGAGLIMLGLNLARYMNGITMSNFSLVLGVIALLAGLSEFVGVNLPLFPILLILIGANILRKEMARPS